jgi:polyisoprenoid-binding protein YceI
MKKPFMYGRILLAIVAITYTTVLQAQHFIPTDNGSSIKFTIKNLGFNTNGTFTGLKGNVIFQPDNLPASTFTVSVDAATVNTDNSTRDKHLKKEEYFDVAKFPSLSFVSTKITAGTSSGNYNMVGRITIKGISKEITFPFSAHAQGNGYQFTGNFKLNRRDFGVGSSSMMLSDNLNVVLVVAVEKTN